MVEGLTYIEDLFSMMRPAVLRSSELKVHHFGTAQVAGWSSGSSSGS